jgi:hypothetical protein
MKGNFCGNVKIGRSAKNGNYVGRRMAKKGDGRVDGKARKNDSAKRWDGRLMDEWRGGEYGGYGDWGEQNDEGRRRREPDEGRRRRKAHQNRERRQRPKDDGGGEGIWAKGNWERELGNGEKGD